jgi:hypothetical protein
LPLAAQVEKEKKNREKGDVVVVARGRYGRRLA